MVLQDLSFPRETQNSTDIPYSPDIAPTRELEQQKLAEVANIA
jgi:hypothetical protein